GLLSMDLAIRRRLRVNGTLTAVGPHGLTIEADQAYGNCPSYIQQRVVEPAVEQAATVDAGALIRGADTFFLGTIHPTRGADTSHKGGRPGFVRLDGTDLWWPDYAGNNMFNSLGNIAVDPEAALLFVDFATGATLHLTGTAELEWITPGSPGDDGDTGRRVRFHPERVLASALPIRAGAAHPSPYNPALRQ
ncbi:MAG TPA: pyridoxamine 5'-phosphate oxidase family protein, partial [Pseudonocardiaceae bacterium]|nr:pyridoxamine 5'-phosphate oxidase family protein [Pseudonocardiaceae bacterium]